MASDPMNGLVKALWGEGMRVLPVNDSPPFIL